MAVILIFATEYLAVDKIYKQRTVQVVEVNTTCVDAVDLSSGCLNKWEADLTTLLGPLTDPASIITAGPQPLPFPCDFSNGFHVMFIHIDISSLFDNSQLRTSHKMRHFMVNAQRVDSSCTVHIVDRFILNIIQNIMLL